MEYVIMTVGKTHSGKTTFGKELANKLKRSCVLDFDILGDFFKVTYPWLYESNLFKNSKDSTQWHYLKLKVRNEILKQALKTNLPIVFTSANSTKTLRSKASNLVHKAWKKIVMVYFNWPENILLDRIAHSGRSKLCLTHSKDFKDLLLNRQSKIFEAPNTKEADIFFEINDDKSWKEVQSKILKIIQK